MTSTHFSGNNERIIFVDIISLYIGISKMTFYHFKDTPIVLVSLSFLWFYFFET